ncbi:MAG: DUF1801 domain-containing protein [Planctomycetota bacterium]
MTRRHGQEKKRPGERGGGDGRRVPCGLTGRCASRARETRKTIRSAAPKAEECISYQIPAYKQHGLLVGFAALKSHCTLHVMSPTVMREHVAELKGYALNKASIRFPPHKPLPSALIRKLVKARIAENKRGATALPLKESPVSPKKSVSKGRSSPGR